MSSPGRSTVGPSREAASRCRQAAPVSGNQTG
jgi:hypothetical protein